ncbi:zinc finger protein 883-like [Cydia splendana]|uniref:zinc finger protein 883-like n=1 Tax=Cydia splendana TaxID=1100963 RepID=UPI00300C8518
MPCRHSAECIDYATAAPRRMARPKQRQMHIKEELQNGHHSYSLKEAEYVKHETECENEVKEDTSCTDSGCGVSEAAMLSGLYTDHEVKDELVLGQECPYRPDVTLVVNGRVSSMLRDCCVTLERLSHVEALAKRQDTTYTDTESDTEELYAREKVQICDLCGESFCLKTDLLKHVMDHIHSPSSAEQEEFGHSFAFDGQWTQEQERALCRKHAIRDCCVLLKRLQHHEALAGNDTQYITQTDTESDTEEVHTRVDYEKPTCDLCGESFALKSDLKKHIMIHIHVPTTHHPQAGTDRESDTEEKNIDIDCENEPTCEFCGEKFALDSNLMKHVMIHMYVARTKQMYEHSEINTYECDICGKILQRKNSLKRHIKTHSTQSKSKDFKCYNIGEKSYNCETCDKRFIDRDRLKRHLIIHTDIRPYSCDVCEKRFRTGINLKKHTLIHGDIRPYLCDVCKKRFRYLSHLKRHTRIHGDIRPYLCDVCKKRFRTGTDLKKHTLIHGDIRPYLCDVCKKRFKTGTGLEIHTRRHTGEKPYICRICRKSFVSNSGLYEHIRTHTGIRPYYCETCGKRFAAKCRLKRHLLIHTDIRPYSCDVCEKRFRYATHLKVHTRIHGDIRPYLCEVCEKRFRTGTDLKIHKRLHTGEKPYTCKICGMSFASNSRMRSHIRIHTDIRPYSCVECKKRFLTAYCLKIHIQLHTREKPFSCDICNMRYLRKKELVMHKFTIHELRK